MDAADLAFAGAVRQAELIRAREVSSRELTELYLERIHRLDPQLNAYRVVLDERALAEADQADARAKAGDKRPLLGVPIAIKDDMDVAGEATAFGSDAHGGPVAADAEVVRRLRSAGAVILGKTHVPELTVTPWTESPTYGATRNPWDLHRTPGGSSGGTGAAVAAGLCGAAIGSDGAGSIRIPAACCGLFGLKPQNGRVPTAPVVEPWHGMSTWGALTRGVADSALIYDAIKDGGPSFAEAAARQPGRLRIAVSLKTPPLTGVQADAEQLSGVSAVAEALRALGHEVIEREIDYPLTWAATCSRATCAASPTRRARCRTPSACRAARTATGGRVRRSRTRCSSAPSGRRPTTSGRSAAPSTRRRRRADADVHPPPAARRRVRGAPGAVDVPRAPCASCPSAGPYNHTGQPAASVPAAWTADGFPVGAQLVAPRDGEPLLLSLAAQLEGALRLDRAPAGDGGMNGLREIAEAVAREAGRQLREAFAGPRVNVQRSRARPTSSRRPTTRPSG